VASGVHQLERVGRPLLCSGGRLYIEHLRVDTGHDGDDAWLLTRSPAASYISAQELAIPLVIGSNTLESGGGPETPEQARKEIHEFMGDLAPHALALYG
jgi:hypothetical protein